MKITAVYKPLPWQIEPWKDRSPVLLLTGAAGGGKALHVETPILTMKGWLTMGEIHPGDVVFDENGEPCNVVAVSDVMTGRPCYKLKFSTGQEIISDGSHEWFTRTIKERRAESENLRRGINAGRTYGKVRTTIELLDTVSVGKTKKRSNHAVRIAKPIKSPQNEPLFIPPYALGAWLGDGHSKSGDITCHIDDDEIIQNVIDCGYKRGKRRGQYTTPIVGLGFELSEMGLINNKHIPDEYFTACHSDRMALLQGLMDTDGSIDVNGRVEICQVNRSLIVDIQRLLSTLGIRSSIIANRAGYRGYKTNSAGYFVDCGVRYRISFYTNNKIFRLKRKRDRCIANTTDRINWHHLNSVTKVKSVPVRCIQVGSPSRLYLVGDTLVPTHNSRVAAEKVHAFMLKYPGSTGIMGRKDRTSANKSVVPFMRYTVQQDTSWGAYNKADGLFQYHNGSQLWVVGLRDEGQREGLRSIGKDGSVDIAWMEEANKLSEDDHNEISARMRGTSGGFRQRIYTTNPDGPEHWIKKQLIDGGKATVYYSRPEDNPYNPQDYIDTLKGLTGVSYERLWLGRWVQAEGAVYSEYTSAQHLIDWKDIPDLVDGRLPTDGRYIVSIDFGHTNPFTASLWYIDGDGKMYLVRQVYYTKRTVEDHCPAIRKMISSETALEWADRNVPEDDEKQRDLWLADPEEEIYKRTRKLPIEEWVTDHDAEDRATLEKHLNIRTKAAYKAVLQGIEAVKGRLKKSRLFLVRGALVELDSKLERDKRPTCTIDEIAGYRWSDKKQDTPIKENDHGMDDLRYAVAFVDKIDRSSFTIGGSAKIDSYIKSDRVKDEIGF